VVREVLMDFKKAVKLLAVVASVLIAYFLASPLEEKMRVTLTLLVFASGLWITELLPMGIRWRFSA